MPYLKEIVDILNTKLSTGTLARPAFQRGKFYGLAKQVNKVSKDNFVTPVIYDLAGKEIDPTVDDKYSFSIYHRIVNTTYVISPNSFDAEIERTQLVAVVYGSFEGLQMDQYQLSYLVASGISGGLDRSEFSQTGVSAVTVLPANTNQDSAAVLRSEYGIQDYTLDPKDSFFALTYIIEMRAGKNCIPCTEC